MAGDAQADLQMEEGNDRLELPASPYAFALWNLIIRPPRRRYDVARLGPKEFRLWSCSVKRVDVTLTNPRGMKIKCSHFTPNFGADSEKEPRPVVIYLHANASCRLEALPLVPLFLPLGISLFTFDFAGCGESDGEYISLGFFERDDLAVCVDYLRNTGMVSAIGLWGRSMGSVTALMHADRDHSIGGIVLDSPFCSLRQLASELAQSDYLSVKIPSWLLSGALALGRMRIQSLCDFDIDALAPENHVSGSFIPAMFIAARGDDFIAPHHTQHLYEAYNGDKELEMVEGDHNSPRSPEENRKAVKFFCRAFRCDPTTPKGSDGALARLLGVDPLQVDSSTEFSIGNRQLREDACRLLATAGGGRVWLGDRQHIFTPFRIESALQLNEKQTEAGFCVCLFPLPTDWGGVNRPPQVIFVYATLGGLRVSKATEMSPVSLAENDCEIEMGVPFLCALEVRPKSPHLRLNIGTGADIFVSLDDEYSHDVHVWPMSRKGEATFFDCALTDLQPIPGEEEACAESGPEAAEPPAQPEMEEKYRGSDGARSSSASAGFLFGEDSSATKEPKDREGGGYPRREAGAIPRPVPPVPAAAPQQRQERADSGGMCNNQ